MKRVLKRCAKDAAVRKGRLHTFLRRYLAKCNAICQMKGEEDEEICETIRSYKNTGIFNDASFLIWNDRMQYVFWQSIWYGCDS